MVIVASISFPLSAGRNDGDDGDGKREKESNVSHEIRDDTLNNLTQMSLGKKERKEEKKNKMVRRRS